MSAASSCPGTRFYVLKGLGALLQRALIAWMIDLHVTEHGYTEIYPPFVVQEKCLVGAGQLPKFADNLYHDVEDDFWWVPTAEVPVTNLHREEILDPGDPAPLLCRLYALLAPRKDERRAGRAGHQARAPVRQGGDGTSLSSPRHSADELMTPDRQRRGGLPPAGPAPPRRANVHRRPELYGRGQVRHRDLGRGLRRVARGQLVLERQGLSGPPGQIRYRPERGARPQFVHTLNGSGLALPRVMIAVLENYQQADGSVVVPEVLRPYMRGIEVIRPA